MAATRLQFRQFRIGRVDCVGLWIKSKNYHSDKVVLHIDIFHLEKQQKHAIAVASDISILFWVQCQESEPDVVSVALEVLGMGFDSKWFFIQSNGRKQVWIAVDGFVGLSHHLWLKAMGAMVKDPTTKKLRVFMGKNWHKHEMHKIPSCFIDMNYMI